jgi:nitrate reductase alpha subunit
VLPTATWYEKNDLNTSDMHPFIHPLTAAVDPVWECKSDWEIFKAIAKAFSEVCPEVLGVEKDVVLTPIQHDSAGEMAQPFDVKDWWKGECDLVPGKTGPQISVVERDYPNLYRRFTALGPLMDQGRQWRQGLGWNTEHEVELLKAAQRRSADGPTKGLPKIETDIDACETILMLAPETNGEVAVKSWRRSSKQTGREHAHLALAEGRREDSLPRCRRAAAQDHLLADLVGHREREGLLQRRLYECARTDPVAHADRAPAALPGSFWMRAFGEGAVRLQAAG